PPAWICALTTSTGLASSLAALTASSTENAACPRGTGTPNSRSTALAWYSWMFMRASPPTRRPPARATTPEMSLPEIGRDVLAGVDQGGHGLGRLLEHRAFGAAELNFDDALDALGADHGGHAHIEVLETVLAAEIGGAGQHALLVLEEALRHRHGGRRR